MRLSEDRRRDVLLIATPTGTITRERRGRIPAAAIHEWAAQLGLSRLETARFRRIVDAVDRAYLAALDEADGKTTAVADDDE